MTGRPFRNALTCLLGTLAALIFASSAVAQAPSITVLVSAGGDDFTISTDIDAAASANGPYQVPVRLHGQTYYMTEEGFDRFSSFTNFDDMTFSLSGLPPAETGPGAGAGPETAPTTGSRRPGRGDQQNILGPASSHPLDMPGIMFDGVPVDVMFTARDTVAACRAICFEAPDCLAFTYHPGERQCDLFWDVYGEIPDPCCVSGYLD